MESALIVNIIGGCVIALISGAAGSAYQSYRRRFRLYVIPRSVSGKTTSIDQVAPVSNPVLSITEQSSYFPALHEDEPLNNIQQVYNSAVNLETRGPGLASALSVSCNDLKSASAADALLKAIRPVVTQPLFPSFLSAVLVRQRVPWKSVPTATQETIGVIEDGDALLIDPPPGFAPIRIPIRLSYEGGLIKRRIKPLVEGIRAANISAVADILLDVQQSLDAELGWASNLKYQLQPLIEENSRWSLACHIANYGDSAMVLRPNATLEVVNDRRSDPIKEGCSLYRLDGKQFIGSYSA